MPLKRFLSLPQDERDKILCLSSQEFARSGYDSTSLNELIKKLEISKGQFYYWFEDKADLFLTILDEICTGFSSAIMKNGHPQSAETFWQHLEEIDENVIEWLDENHSFFPIFKRVMELPEDHPVQQGIHKLMWPMFLHYGQTIQQGIEFGLVRDDIPFPMLMKMLDEVRTGLDHFELNNSDEMTKEQIKLVQRTRTRITRTILEKVD